MKALKPSAREAIGALVELTESADTLVGKCPFCDERAFHVNDRNRWFYCFACHCSGSPEKFVELLSGQNQDDTAFAIFLGLLDKLNLSDTRAAALVGISPHTVRVSRASRVVPKHSHCRQAIREFVAKNYPAAGAAE